MLKFPSWHGPRIISPPRATTWPWSGFSFLIYHPPSPRRGNTTERFSGWKHKLLTRGRRKFVQFCVCTLRRFDRRGTACAQVRENSFFFRWAIKRFRWKKVFRCFSLVLEIFFFQVCLGPKIYKEKSAKKFFVRTKVFPSRINIQFCFRLRQWFRLFACANKMFFCFCGYFGTQFLSLSGVIRQNGINWEAIAVDLTSFRSFFSSREVKTPRSEQFLLRWQVQPPFGSNRGKFSLDELFCCTNHGVKNKSEKRHDEVTVENLNLWPAELVQVKIK